MKYLKFIMFISAIITIVCLIDGLYFNFTSRDYFVLRWHIVFLLLFISVTKILEKQYCEGSLFIIFFFYYNPFFPVTFLFRNTWQVIDVSLILIILYYCVVKFYKYMKKYKPLKYNIYINFFVDK